MSTAKKSLISRIRNFKKKLYEEGKKRATDIEEMKKEAGN